MLLDRVGYILASSALAFGVVAALFDSFFWAIFLCGLYVAGLVWGTQLICLIRKTLAASNDESKLDIGDSCGLCGKDQCKRHKKLPQHHSIPKVPKGFDSALEHLLEEILKTYVCTWYSDLSSNDAFVQQLRLAIATAITNVTNRLFKADLSHIIFNHLIPLGVHHARDWRELKKRAQDMGGKPIDYIPDLIGSRIHPAAYSREAELNYLRGIVANLLPHLLPAVHISTNNQVILREVIANWVLLPALDALADPDNLNMLISLCTHYDGKFSQSTDTIYVPMLQTWISHPQAAQDMPKTLKPSLEEVLNDPQLLYMFMQHIKDSGLVNLLQFCLDIDDLSKRMLNPEMSPGTEETLYALAQNIYTTYLDPESPDFLNLPAYISQGMKQILDLGPKKVQELRTSRPLYEAHQEAHTLLENTWLPSFHHTYAIYKSFCGEPVINTTVKTSTQNSNSGSGTSGGFRLTSQLSKIRGVLKASAVEGAPFVQPHQVFQAEEANCSPRTGVAQSTSTSAASAVERDLSTWRISVPHVDGGGAQPLYMVSVHSVSEDRSWTVLRRDQDFYALRARLSEFHGDKELNDSPLPTRKNPHPSLTANSATFPMRKCDSTAYKKKLDKKSIVHWHERIKFWFEPTTRIPNRVRKKMSAQICRQRYQDFLQKLLAKPTLRSSELLHAFLTVPNLKPYFANASSTPDIGVLCQSMAHKLRKERGQHLDKFMSTFLASINVKSDQPDMGVEMAADHNFQENQVKGRDLVHLGPFGNNLNLDPRIQNFPYVVNKLQHTKGACFCIAEALDSLIDVPPTVSRLIWVLASTCRPTVDPFINEWFYDMIVTLLSDGRAAIVVKLLHEVIFEDESVEASAAKAEEHYNEAKEGLHNLVPQWVFGVHSKWCELMDSLLEPIQCAPFNKHLAYMLVDQLLVNLFPEAR